MQNLELEIRKRLKNIVLKKGQGHLAAETGYNQGSLSKYLRGQKPNISADTLLNFLEYLGASIVFPEENVPQSFDFEDFMLIPKVEARLGAGQSFLVDNTTEGLYAFRREFLHSIGIRGEKSSVLFGIIGDSMLPVFSSQDTVLVALEQKEIINGKYYALRVNDSIQIKRLEILATGNLRIHSENKELYPPLDTNSADDIDIIGRIRWAGRQF